MYGELVGELVERSDNRERNEICEKSSSAWGATYLRLFLTLFRIFRRFRGCQKTICSELERGVGWRIGREE